MLTREGVKHGTIVPVQYKTGARVGQSPVVAAAAVADGRADVLDDKGEIIEPTLLGIRCGRRTVEMLAINPGPTYPFLILPQAPRNEALAAKANSF